MWGYSLIGLLSIAVICWAQSGQILALSSPRTRKSSLFTDLPQNEHFWSKGLSCALLSFSSAFFSIVNIRRFVAKYWLRNSISSELSGIFLALVCALTNERDFPVPRLRLGSRKRHQACHDGISRFHQHHQEGKVPFIRWAADIAS